MSAPPGAFARVLADLDLAGLSAATATASAADVDAVLGPSRAHARTRRTGAGGIDAGTTDIVGTTDVVGTTDAGTGAAVGVGVAGRRLSLADLAVLLSPAAAERLEDLAMAARAVTVRRFGRAVRLFAPLYVSNACLSSCTYCGFAKGLPVVRRTLTVDEAAREARVLAGRGFRHVLLVSGEHRREVSADYLAAVVEALRPMFPSIAAETQTWSDDTYARLVAVGLDGVVHYQETYDRTRYREVHVSGWKRDYDRRLSSFERAAAAGVRRLGLGVLLGLAHDWRADVLALAAHATFLSRRYWRTEVTASLPRIKPSASGFAPTTDIGDAEFVQAHAALRLFGPDLGLSLSTREPATMRDGLVQIAVTAMSAGSSTEPGGYTSPGTAQEQFSISDERSPAEVAAMLAAAGYDPVWTDAFPLVGAPRGGDHAAGPGAGPAAGPVRG